MNELPSKPQDVVIIGAGFVGIATAMWLQKSGHKVTVVDPEPFAQGAYFGNACTIATYANNPVGTPRTIKQIPKLLFNPNSPLTINWSYLPKLTPWLMRFVWASRPSQVEHIGQQLGRLLIHAQSALMPLIETAQGSDLVKKNGTLYLYGSEAGLVKAQPDIALRRRNGIAVTELTKSEISDLEPHLNPIYKRGLWFENAQHLLNPLDLLKRMGASVVANGGQIVTNKAVGIKRISIDTLKVQLQDTSIQGQKVVVAAGAWSKGLAQQVGDTLPLDTEQGYHLMYKGAEQLLNRPVGWADVGFYMTPMNEGLRAAGTVELAGLNNAANPKRLQLIAKTMKTLLPQLKSHDSEWTGFRPSMPDSMPVISQSSKDTGVYYAFGHGHIGVTLSGITGKLISEMIDGKTPSMDIAAFSAQRF
ncbi:NAD(P)/FAD-dependent oxidoreductase [Candidatus Njordibacter sp. Uisw_058]|uniref:NAD(P)/FAD-dependent oxidoreductase n=1 Tax=Candidatus Njordibacter sp. Uisw_058 TaxID=3230974 RepID=UPI003D37EB54